jgi:folate-binding protein YgfZ
MVSPSKDYLAAHESVAYYRVPNPGFVLISGETRRAYLQRQTTNDIDLLSPTLALTTLLTAPNGHILEHYTLLDKGDAIIMLTQPGHGPGNAAYFQKRVFFNDQVVIQDQSADWAIIELLGPKSPELLAHFKLRTVPTYNEVIELNWRGIVLRIFGMPDFGAVPRSRILIPANASSDFIAELVSTAEVTFNTREILRIEAGVAGDPEFSAEATPFELGLEHLVSTTKGCYTGQEVLARQVTYDKVVRRLVRVQINEPLAPGLQLHVEGKTVGKVTSAAISPTLGPIGLAIIRKPYDAAGGEVAAILDNRPIQAKVI